MTAKMFCLTGIGVYTLLSVADFVLTFALIRSSGGAVVESNPVAAACLERHGWDGLAVFKLGGVAAFIASVGLITARRPNVAATLVVVGCVVLTGVTTYSNRMLGQVRQEHAERAAAWGAARVKYDPKSDPLVAWIPTL